MNAIAPRVPALAGGSADLDPSTHTALKGLGDFNPPSDKDDDTQGSAGGGWSHKGRNLHFGVREHAMGAIVNGLAAHGGFIPYGATFLIFSDYMRPPMRLAALMGLHIVHVFRTTASPSARTAHPSAGGAVGQSARDPGPHRDPPRRRQ
jgi:transketolase